MTQLTELQQLLAYRSFGSFAELYGAVRKVVGDDVSFDCFEEWQSGEVIIRKQPVGGEGGWLCDFIVCLTVQQGALTNELIAAE